MKYSLSITKNPDLHTLKKNLDAFLECKDYCPLGLDVTKVLDKQDYSSCIKCLYCYMVCPSGALELEGSFGFLKAQINKYDPLIREVA